MTLHTLNKRLDVIEEALKPTDRKVYWREYGESTADLENRLNKRIRPHDLIVRWIPT